MEKVTVFLRAALFTLPGESGHVPQGVAVIEGKVVDWEHGCIKVEASKLLDERGRVLAEKKLLVVLPLAKVDHLVQR